MAWGCVVIVKEISLRQRVEGGGTKIRRRLRQRGVIELDLHLGVSSEPASCSAFLLIMLLLISLLPT